MWTERFNKRLKTVSATFRFRTGSGGLFIRLDQQRQKPGSRTFWASAVVHVVGASPVFVPFVLYLHAIQSFRRLCVDFEQRGTSLQREVVPWKSKERSNCFRGVDAIISVTSRRCIPRSWEWHVCGRSQPLVLVISPPAMLWAVSHVLKLEHRCGVYCDVVKSCIINICFTVHLCASRYWIDHDPCLCSDEWSSQYWVLSYDIACIY